MNEILLGCCLTGILLVMAAVPVAFLMWLGILDDQGLTATITLFVAWGGVALVFIGLFVVVARELTTLVLG